MPMPGRLVGADLPEGYEELTQDGVPFVGRDLKD